MFYRAGLGVSPILTLLDRLEGKPAPANSHDSPPTSSHPFFSPPPLKSQKRKHQQPPNPSPPPPPPPPSYPPHFPPHQHQHVPQKSGPPSIFEFLDEDDLLQECRANNPRLVDYLCRDENIETFIMFATRGTPPVDLQQEMMAAGGLHQNPKRMHYANGERQRDKGDNAQPQQNQGQEKESMENGDAEQNEQAHVMGDSSGSDPEYEEYAEQLFAKMRIKYSYVCAEVLSAEVVPLMDKVLQSDRFSSLLFSCLEEYEPGYLDPALAAHFVKIMVAFLKSKNSETLDRIVRRETLIPAILKHLDLDVVAELIVRILDPPGSDRSFHAIITPPSQDALNLLASHEILAGLSSEFVNCLSHTSVEDQRRCEDVMSNVISAMHEITHRVLQLPHLAIDIPDNLSLYSSPQVVTKLLDAGLEQVRSNHSPFLLAMKLTSDILTTEANVKQDYDVLNPPAPAINPAILGRGRRPPLGGGLGPHFYGGVPGGGGGGRRRFSFNSPYQTQHADEKEEEEEEEKIKSPVDELPVGATIVSTGDLEELLRPRFAVLANMLGNTSEAEGPLGSVRLKIAEFFSACLKVGSRETVDAVVEIGVPKKVLGLFTAYKWSSILHGVVAGSIRDSLEQADTVRGEHAAKAWIDAGVLPWIVETWHKDEEDQESAAPSCGYKGHLIQIGVSVQTFIEKYVSLDEDGEENKEHDEKDTSELFDVAELKERYGIDEDTAQRFYQFCTDHLAPARQVELTPLCDGDPRPGSDNDEFFEEPTEVFDMSDVIDGLTQSNDAIEHFTRQLINLSGDANIEEEEVAVVDTDLSHFQDDGEDSDDDDVAQELAWEKKRQRERSTNNRKADSVERSSDPRQSPRRFLESIDEQGAIATIESSDDEEGTYEEFVADKSSSRERTGKDLSPKRGTAKLSSPSLNVADAVTEIDDAPSDRPSSAKVITEVDDDDLSSDEDDDDWVDFSEVEKAARPSASKRSSGDASSSMSADATSSGSIAGAKPSESSSIQSESDSPGVSKDSSEGEVDPTDKGISTESAVTDREAEHSDASEEPEDGQEQTQKGTGTGYVEAEREDGENEKKVLSDADLSIENTSAEQSRDPEQAK